MKTGIAAVAMMGGVLGLGGHGVPVVQAGPDPGSAPSAVTAAGDTVVDVRRGDRLVLRNLVGRLVIEGVDGSRATLVGDRREAGVGLARDGDRIVLNRVVEGRRRQRSLTLRVPRWLPVEAQGSELDVTISGLRSDVTVRTTEGDLDVRDVEGAIDLHTVDGEVRLDDVVGSVRAVSVDESVVVRGARGSVRVESNDGDLRLDDVDGDRVEAQTTDGDVVFRGPIRPGGTYRFVTHDGDVTVSVPRGSAAQVSVSTFDGSFSAGFPVSVERYRGGRETTFMMGDGAGAHLVIQAFDGDIRLEYTDGGR